MRAYLIAASLTLVSAPALAADVARGVPVTPPPLAVAGPAWTVYGSAEAVWLWRTGDRTDFQVANGSPGASASDLDLNRLGNGADVRAGVAAGPFGVSVRYLGNFSWQQSLTTAGTTTVFTTPNVNQAPGPSTFVHAGDLHAIEANLTWQRSMNVRLLAGVRWVDLGDRFSDDFNGIANLAFAAGNKLMGPQVGLEADVVRGSRLSIGVEGRLGYFRNAVALSGTTSGIGGAQPSFGRSEPAWGVGGEARVALGYLLTDHVRLQADYRVAAFDQVATVMDNFGTANIATGVVGPINRRALWFHGFSAGVMVAW